MVSKRGNTLKNNTFQSSQNEGNLTKSFTGFSVGAIGEIAKNLFNVSTSIMVYSDNTESNIKTIENASPSEIEFILFAIEASNEHDLITFLGSEQQFNIAWPHDHTPYGFCFGFKIRTTDDTPIGTLFLLDKEQRELPKNADIIVSSLTNEIRLKYATQQKLSSLQGLCNNLKIENKEIKCARSIVEMMHDGLTVQNQNGEILLANPSAYRILGIKDLASTNSNARDEHWCVTDEFDNELSWRKHPSMIALHTNTVLTNEIIKVNRPDGTSIWLSVNATPFTEEGDDAPSKVFVTFADISAQKEIEINLTEEKEGAEAANASKSAFLANMSHEIRTPLNGIIGVADVLLKTDLSQRQLEMAKIIESSSKVLLTLLNDILDYSKVEAGKIQIETRPFDLKNATEEAANLMRIQADEKGIDFRVILSQDLQIAYAGDVVRFKQIISNLASNAVKFTEEGAVEIEVSPCLSSEGVEISVRDTGIGMKSETVASLFKRFGQADNSITRKFGGTGLGLAICKSLVELMGGTIEVSSKLKVGTQFIVYLPFKSVKEYNLANSCGTKSKNTMTQHLDILLVEDHPMNQKVFELMVSHLDKNLTIVENGQLGLDEFQMKKFDIIFMDMHMPVMGGVKATKEIREIEKQNNLNETPIVMLTANAGEEYGKIALDAGANYHLTKPTTIEGINQVITSILSQKNSPPQDFIEIETKLAS